MIYASAHATALASAHAGAASFADLYPILGIGINGKQVQPFVPSLRTSPLALTTVAKSPIKSGAAVVYVSISQSAELPFM